jgi:hypothetical protein
VGLHEIFHSGKGFHRRKYSKSTLRFYVLGYGLDDNGIRFPAGARYFPLFHIVQTGSAANTASCSIGTGVYCRGQSDWGMRLTTHLDLMPRLSMIGAISRLSVYAFWHGQEQFYTLFSNFIFSTLIMRGI